VASAAGIKLFGGASSYAESQLLWQSGVLTYVANNWVQYTISFLPNANYNFMRIRSYKPDGSNSNILIDNISPIETVPASASVGNHINCFGGTDSAASIIAAGSPGYNLHWGTFGTDNGVLTSTGNNLPAGTHNVTITDAFDPCVGPMNATVTGGTPS
jgi:hypothetical protein